MKAEEKTKLANDLRRMARNGLSPSDRPALLKAADFLEAEANKHECNDTCCFQGCPA